MLDIRWIRDNREALDRALMNRGEEPAAERLVGLDDARRTVIARAQDVQTRRNAASKEIGKAKASGDEARAAELIAEVAKLKDDAQRLEEEERQAVKALEEALAWIPNIPLDDVPVGPDETANREIRHWPKERAGDAPPLVDGAREHFELGEALGQMDFETAAKLSGSRFVVLKGRLARLERALGQFMLDLHVTEHGYTEVQPPLLVRPDVLFGTGQLPKFIDDQFYSNSLDGIYRVAVGAYPELEKSSPYDQRFKEVLTQEMEFEGRWLIPTAEVPLTNLARETILTEDELPLRFTALTPCFRSEAGSAGKDTRGMLRQHQFDKVELVSITTPEKSTAEHERMTECAETVLKKLGLAFRTVVLSTGDMGFGARKTYDIEVWLPGQRQYREISSCSVCGDFQARRMNARYRPEGDKGTQFVHTLNGSGVAVGRALIAVMETFQNPDGSIAVPDALRRYMGGIETIAA